MRTEDSFQAMFDLTTINDQIKYKESICNEPWEEQTSTKADPIYNNKCEMKKMQAKNCF